MLTYYNTRSAEHFNLYYSQTGRNMYLLILLNFSRLGINKQYSYFLGTSHGLYLIDSRSLYIACGNLKNINELPRKTVWKSVSNPMYFQTTKEYQNVFIQSTVDYTKLRIYLYMLWTEFKEEFTIFRWYLGMLNNPYYVLAFLLGMRFCFIFIEIENDFFDWLYSIIDEYYLNRPLKYHEDLDDEAIFGAYISYSWNDVYLNPEFKRIEFTIEKAYTGNLYDLAQNANVYEEPRVLSLKKGSITRSVYHVRNEQPRVIQIRNFSYNCLRCMCILSKKNEDNDDQVLDSIKKVTEIDFIIKKSEKLEQDISVTGEKGAEKTPIKKSLNGIEHKRLQLKLLRRVALARAKTKRMVQRYKQRQYKIKKLRKKYKELFRENNINKNNLNKVKLQLEAETRFKVRYSALSEQIPEIEKLQARFEELLRLHKFKQIRNNFEEDLLFFILIVTITSLFLYLHSGIFTYN
jgi:hypothetical protein